MRRHTQNVMSEQNKSIVFQFLGGPRDGQESRWDAGTPVDEAVKFWRYTKAGTVGQVFEGISPVQAMDDLSTKEFDVVFAIGTSAVFDYIKRPVSLAQSRNKPTVEINPTQTTLSWSCQYRIQLGAADAMQRIWARVN